jgi:hypothetical protein
MKRPLNVTVNKNVERRTTQIMIEVDVDAMTLSNDDARAFEMVLLKLWATPSTGSSMLEKLLAGLHQLKRAMDDAEYARQMAMKHQAQQIAQGGKWGSPYGSSGANNQFSAGPLSRNALQGLSSVPSQNAITNVAQAANIAGITGPDLTNIVHRIYHEELQRYKEQQDKNLRARSWMDKLLGVK